MLLALDVGNTNIVIGLFHENKLTHKWRLQTNSKKSVDDYAVDMIELFLTEKIDCLKINAAIIASVVPALNETLTEAIKKFTSEVNFFEIGDEKTDLNIEITLNNKGEIGADRLINSIAAYKKFGGNLIIIDFGTATTFDVVGKYGEYLGGAISPGVNLALKALHDMTAQLPKITVKSQKNVIGKNTIEAMNSGVYFGYIAMIEGMIAKIENELNCQTTCIITGGLADLFKDALKEAVKYHEPNLTLDGLRMVYEDNKHKIKNKRL